MKTHPANTSLDRSNYAPRVIALGVLALLFLCALARASAQPADKATTSPVGVYALASVDGRSVPCAIKHEGATMNVHSGAITIATNGQISSVMTVSLGDRKNIRVERSATYTVKNSELVMKWENAGITRGRVTGQTFTMTNEGMAYVYRK